MSIVPVHIYIGGVDYGPLGLEQIDENSVSLEDTIERRGLAKFNMNYPGPRLEFARGTPVDIKIAPAGLPSFSIWKGSILTDPSDNLATEDFHVRTQVTATDNNELLERDKTQAIYSIYNSPIGIGVLDQAAGSWGTPSGGTGYHALDVLTIAGGIGGTIRVDTVSSGAVATWTILTPGNGYSATIGTLQVTTGGFAGSSGATFHILNLVGGYPNPWTASQIITDPVSGLIATQLAQFGISAGVMPDGSSGIKTGASYTNLPVNYQTGKELLDRLSTDAGYFNYVNINKELFFLPQGSMAAPMNITSALANFLAESMKFADNNSTYRNTQIIRGGYNTLQQHPQIFVGNGTDTNVLMDYQVMRAPTAGVCASGTITFLSGGIPYGAAGVPDGHPVVRGGTGAQLTYDASGLPIISSTSVSAATNVAPGTNYTTGDILTLVPAGNGAATITITSVDSSGAILAATVLAAGASYLSGQRLTVYTTVAGSTLTGIGGIVTVIVDGGGAVTGVTVVSGGHGYGLVTHKLNGGSGGTITVGIQSPGPITAFLVTLIGSQYQTGSYTTTVVASIALGGGAGGATGIATGATFSITEVAGGIISSTLIGQQGIDPAPASVGQKLLYYQKKNDSISMNFWQTHSLLSAEALIVIADVGYPIIVKAINAVGVSAHAAARTGTDSGIISSLEEDTNYEYASQALTKANALLKKYDLSDIVDFDTFQDLLSDPIPQWWRGGQMVTFDIPELNNTFTCLITKVTASFFASNSGGTAIKWHITCNTNMQGVDYEQWFSDLLLSKSQIIINEAPSILFGLTPLETLTLTDTVTITTRDKSISPFLFNAARWNLSEF